jgi:endonuclease YncB( thermonuclease family)
MRFWALACTLLLCADAYAQSARSVGDLVTGRANAVAGDTLDIGDERIRVWGIDAPDPGARCARGGKDWRPARESTVALEDCLKETTITCRVQRIDGRRYVSECWRDDNQEDVGACMVRSGWATDAPGFSGAHYASLEAEPKAKQRGLWACSGEPPTRRWCAGVGVPCERVYYKPRGPGMAEAAATSSPQPRIPNCTVAEAQKQAQQLADEFVGQGWKADRVAPWQLGQVTAALATCGFAKGPRWADLEMRALTFRHPTTPNVVLMKRGHDSLAKDTLGLGVECQCALAIQHFGPRGTDLDGILKTPE